MSAQDILIGLLVVALGLTWVIGARVMRRLTTDIDELARERVDHSETPSSVGRTLGQLQVAADNLAEALATRTERLYEVMAQADTQAATIGEAITVAHALAQRLSNEVTALRVQISNDVVASSTVPDQLMTQNGHRNGAETYGAGSGWTVVPPIQVTDGRTVNPSATGASNGLASVPSSVDEVRRLALDGVDLATIARRTNRGREEVRLLLRFAGGSTTGELRRTDNGREASGTTGGVFRS